MPSWTLKTTEAEWGRGVKRQEVALRLFLSVLQNHNENCVKREREREGQRDKAFNWEKIKVVTMTN